MDVLRLNEIESVKTRILSKVSKTESGCWLYRGSKKNNYGHVQISIRNRSYYAHRIAYEAFIGSIPAGLQVCHTCDVPNCVNPGHFFTGTQKVNVDDMWRKGRAVKPPKHTGLKNHKASLTTEQIGDIRRRVGSGEHQRDVAALYGCSQSTVWRLFHRLSRIT